jgi:predicted acyltransferase
MNSPPSRFIALDMFRGLAIALMILVNTPGDWSHVYSPLLHSDWHGLTPTDVVFPCFLFIVGASISFAFGPTGFVLNRATASKVLKRSAIMFAIGGGLNIYNAALLDLDSIRIMGVLQRISICYFLATMLLLSCRISTVYWVSGVTLTAYFLLFIALGGAAPFAFENNIVGAIDRAILGQAHMWKMHGVAFDPEGLVSTLPATITLLMGFETARRLRSAPNPHIALRQLMLAGFGLLVIGYLSTWLMPINKNLWSISFVFLSACLAIFTLAACLYLSDIKKISLVSEPFRIYGTNPLLIYCLSWLMATGFMSITLDVFGSSTSESLYTFLWRLLLPIMSPELASLVFALAHVVFFWLVAVFFYRRDIVLKI